MTFSSQIISPTSPRSIAITGGKGGTGKTLIATNLAVYLHSQGNRVLLVDCDTENPNSNILLGKNLTDEDVQRENIEIFVPNFDSNRCTHCGKCRTACYRHAILQFGDNIPSVMDHMCSGCQTCLKICPENAVSANFRPIGMQYYTKDLYHTENQFDLLIGELNEGEAVSVLIVEYLLETAIKLNDALPNDQKYDYIIIDTSPGAHCDVEHSLENADMIIGVTEPTPFGVHDLKRILDLIALVNKKAKIIINRSDLTEYRAELDHLSEEYQSEILGEIPLSQEIIEDYARGTPFILDSRVFVAKDAFIKIYSKIIQSTKGGNI